MNKVQSGYDIRMGQVWSPKFPQGNRMRFVVKELLECGCIKIGVESETYPPFWVSRENLLANYSVIPAAVNPERMRE